MFYFILIGLGLFLALVFFIKTKFVPTSEVYRSIYFSLPKRYNISRYLFFNMLLAGLFLPSIFIEVGDKTHRVVKEYLRNRHNNKVDMLMQAHINDVYNKDRATAVLFFNEIDLEKHTYNYYEQRDIDMFSILSKYSFLED